MNRLPSIALAALSTLALLSTFASCKKNEARPPIETEGTPPLSQGGGGADAGDAGDAAVGTSNVLVANVPHPQAIALDATYVYFAIDGTVADDGGIASRTGTVNRVARTGGAVTTLAEQQDLPSAIALAQTGTAATGFTTIGVAWSNFGTAQSTGGASFLPANSTAITLVTGESVPSITADATYAYWLSDLGLSGVVVERALLTGTSPDQLGTVQGPVTSRAITSDGTSLYFVAGGDGGGVFRMPIQGGNIDNLVLLPNASLADIVVIGSTLYVADAQLAPNGSIFSIPAAGGTVTTLAGGQDAPTRLAHDATTLYWTNDDTAGSVVSLPIAGGTPTVIAANLDHPRGIAVDDALYVTTTDAILRIAK